MIEWLQELNPQQRAAAEFGNGPLLIIAGAGSGKTKTLAARVAVLVHRGCDPSRIMLLTFTRRAAHEMLHRAQATTSNPAIHRVWGGTFHSIGARLLRTYAESLSIHPDFTILDQSDAADLIDMVRRDIGMTSFQGKRAPQKKTLIGIYSRAVNTGLNIHQVLARFYPGLPLEADRIRELFKNYALRKQERNLLDYDDLLLLWNRLLDHEAVREHLNQTFEHILVDEYQDTNHLQAQILQKMRALNPNISVVGDDAQSIYAFRGADIHNILAFPEQFPDCTVIKLETNYRSQQPILDLANHVIAQAQHQYTKILKSARTGAARPEFVHALDEETEAEFVAHTVLELLEEGIPLSKQAVLFRSAFHSAQLEITLPKHKIPFRKFGGLRFVESAHIKDILAVLRIAENPRDQIAWMRILLLIPGIGPTSSQRLLDHFLEQGADLTQLNRLAPPAKSKESFAQLAGVLNEIGGDAAPSPQSQIEYAYRFYAPLLENKYDNANLRARDLEELGAIAQSAPTRKEFLSDLALDPLLGAGGSRRIPQAEDDYLTLSTIHSAKGCEWDTVFLLHAAEGMIPSGMSMHDPLQLAEERRLFYVALTRARNRLLICYPGQYRSRNFRGGRNLNQRTSFLDRKAMELLDTRSAGEMLSEQSLSISGGQAGSDIGRSAMQSMIDMWNEEPDPDSDSAS